MTVKPKLMLKRAQMDDLAFGMLVLFIFCVPWEEEVAIGKTLAMSHFVGVATALVGVITCLTNRRIRKPGPVHYLAGALVIWSVMSYSWSIAPELTVVRAGSFCQMLLMVWLIWEFAPTDKQQMVLVGAFVMGSWVASLSILYSFITGTGENLGLAAGRYTAAGFNENEVGIILALSLGMSFYLLVRNKAPRVLWFLHIPVCLLAILLTGSRGSFIAAMVALTMFPFSLGSFSKIEKRVGGIILVLVTAVVLLFVPQRTWDRVGSIEEEISQGTLTKRTFIWQAGLDAYRDHPVIGVGAGAFEASVYKQLDIAYVAHNSYLSVLVEMGAIGATLFVAILVSLAKAALALPRGAKAAWVTLLLTWGVSVMSVTWEQRKPTWFLFGLLMAQYAALRPSRLHSPRRREISNAFSRSMNPAGLPFAHAQELHPEMPAGFAAGQRLLR